MNERLLFIRLSLDAQLDGDVKAADAFMEYAEQLREE